MSFLKTESKLKLNILLSQPSQRRVYLGLVIIAVTASLSIYNIFYGIGICDEPFYLSIPYRFVLGDRPFIDEWHVSQLSGVLLYPIVWLFVKINGSAEGIILFSRALFILCQTAVSCYIFYKFKRYGFGSSLFAALIFELYVPCYTMSLNYYTLSMFPFIIVSIGIIFNQDVSNGKLVLYGALFACSVLAEPIFILLYICWFLAIVVCVMYKNHTFKLLTFRSFTFATTGASLIAVLFFVFLFLREKPSEFISALQNIFKSGEYSSATMLIGFRDYMDSLKRDFGFLLIVAVLFIAVIVLDRKRNKRRGLWVVLGFSISVGCVLSIVISCVVNKTPLSLLNLPFVLSFIGLTAFILQTKKDYHLIWLWLMGVSYTVLIALISEAMYYVGSYGLIISCVASVLLVFEFSGERQNVSEKRLNRNIRQKAKNLSIHSVRAVTAVSLFLVGSFLCMFTVTMLLRDPASSVFEREKLTQTVEIDCGAYKGVRVSPEQREIYDALLSDITSIESIVDGKYTVLSENSWYLFSSDRAPLTYTLWFDPFLLDVYYDYFDYKDEIPQCIYIVDKAFYFGRNDSDLNKEKFKDKYSSYFWTRVEELRSSEETIAKLESVFRCDIIKGEAGYILLINGRQ